MTLNALVRKEEKLEAKEAGLLEELSKSKVYKDYLKTKTDRLATTLSLIKLSVEEITDDHEAGDAVDTYRRLKDYIDTVKNELGRYAESSHLDELTPIYKDLERALISLFKSQKLTQVTGHVGKLSYFTETVAQVEDWEKFTKYLADTNNFSLITKKINNAVFRELRDSGENVLGLKPYTVDKTRIGKK